MSIDFDEAVLSTEDEHALSRSIEAGLLARQALDSGTAPPAAAPDLEAVARAGEEAFRRLVSANLRLVALVTNPVARRSGLDPDELFQEGALGLIEAARRFDHLRGARFATFALPWIRLRVGERAATRFGDLGLSAARAKRWIRVRAAENALYSRLGRTPSPAEIARASGLSATQVVELQAFRAPITVDVDEVLAGRAASGPEAGLDPLALARLLRGLDREDRGILARLYGLGRHPVHSYAEVADALGISVSTVRRRERTALALLRGRAVRADLAA